MNKIQKIACLIGMMILPIGSAVAAPYGGMGELVLAVIFIPIFMLVILPFYTMLRLAYLFHGISLFKNKQNMGNWLGWSFLLLFLDVPIFGFGFDIGYEFYKSQQKRQEQKRIYQERVQENVFNAKPESHVTLTKAQKIAGIVMPKGTKIELSQNLSPELPEYKKIRSATFPKPVMWNGIQIAQISNYFSYDGKHEINVLSESQIKIGKWSCGNTTEYLINKKTPKNTWRTWTQWKPFPHTIENLNDDNFEQSMYLHSCKLTDAQTVNVLPVFEIADVPVYHELVRRENNVFQDASQGLWLVHGSARRLELDAQDLTLLVDSEKTVHGFSFKLREPHAHCHLYKNTLLAWHKSQPDTFFVAHEENTKLYSKRPEYYQSCWFKGIQPVSLEEMQKIMSQ